MTKAEYIAQLGPKATSMGQSKEFIALLETAREENPYHEVHTQEIPAVQLGALATGWEKCLKWLKTAHVPAKPVMPKDPVRPYHDPEKNNLPQTTENKPKP